MCGAENKEDSERSIIPASVYVYLCGLLAALPPFTCSYSAVIHLSPPPPVAAAAALNISSQPYQFSAGSCLDWTPAALSGRVCVCVTLLWMST